MATTTSAAPSAMTSAPSTGSSGPSSPLLFFVALGFGVVFTNLWIIVGVKYCFRYNQRNRQRMAGHDPDAVDLGTMQRPRRRREKKLMTMDEVNERFPLTKYKTWRSSRADEGLPTSGGITTDSKSRPASIKDVEREVKENTATIKLAHTSTASTIDEDAATNAETHGKPEETGLNTNIGEVSLSGRASTEPPDTPSLAKLATNDEDAEHDESEQIQEAIPAEQLPDPGDACAICLDNIDDDDDIRGLQCGHAFHASCVDPWLTSRRACCPLCKADYYVPKPRAEGEQEDLRRRGNGAGNIPSAPQFAFMGRGGGFGRRHVVLPGRFMTIVPDDRAFSANRRALLYNQRLAASHGRSGRGRDNETPDGTVDTTNDTSQQQQATQSTWRQRLAHVRVPYPFVSQNRRSANDSSAPEVTTEGRPTPAQLEAGTT